MSPIPIVCIPDNTVAQRLDNRFTVPHYRSVTRWNKSREFIIGNQYLPRIHRIGPLSTGRRHRMLVLAFARTNRLRLYPIDESVDFLLTRLVMPLQRPGRCRKRLLRRTDQEHSGHNHE